MINKYHLTVILTMLLSIAYSQSSYTFNAKPRYEIEARSNNISLGVIEIELFPEIAPLHVRNFDSLVAHQFYDTTAFHRVIPGFMIQGGDPNSRHGPTSTWGFGQTGQATVPAEFSQLSHLRGILSAARKGNDINSATSQFFICVANATHLDSQYSIYGKVRSGMNVVDMIVNAPRNMTNNMPLQKIEMFVKRLQEDVPAPGSPMIINPAYGKREISSSVTLMWTAVHEVQFYQLQVSTDETFISEVDSMKVSIPHYTKTQLKDSTIYHWRVRANDGGTFGPFVYGKFSTVGETTDINSYEQTEPLIFPNPSTGQFTFIDLLRGSEIAVYNTAGRLVSSHTITGQEFLLGLKEGPGLYFYVISRAGEHYARGKLICR